MNLLNIGCGAVRPGYPWVNLDNLHEQLKHGTPERENLDKETNYINWDLYSLNHIPSEDDYYDGILLSHVIEHFDCQASVSILKDCKRSLKPGGMIVVSVPDAEYFLKVHDQDKPENALELFGEPICPAEPWHESFFNYALFYEQHKQVLTHASLECILIRAGLKTRWLQYSGETHREIEKIMNRRKFSVEMIAMK